MKNGFHLSSASSSCEAEGGRTESSDPQPFALLIELCVRIGR
jgi:hypothetical protein